MTPQVNPGEGARLRAPAERLHSSPEAPEATAAAEMRSDARGAPGQSLLAAVLDALDEAIAATGPGDRPGLMVALAARLAQLGIGLVVSSTKASGGPSPGQQQEPQEESERWIAPEQASEARSSPPSTPRSCSTSHVARSMTSFARAGYL